MKQNRLTTLLAAGAVSAIALTSTFAEDATATATPAENTTTATTSTSTSPMEASGVVVAYKAGLDFITIKTESSTAPIMYYYSKSTAVVGKDGKKGEWSMIKPDMTVKYTYINDGDRMLISRIEVQKPKSSSEKPAAKP